MSVSVSAYSEPGKTCVDCRQHISRDDQNDLFKTRQTLEKRELLCAIILNCVSIIIDRLY